MMNITEQSIHSQIDKGAFKSYRYLNKKTSSRMILKVLLILSILSVICLCLPWTQNIRSNGLVTTLNPYDKPQNIQALIGGQINQWYVTEGDEVNIGDTIVSLLEAKEDYLDPNLLANTKEQFQAKMNAAQAYENKQLLLVSQMEALEQNQQTKLAQISIKQTQIDLEIKSLEADLVAAKTYALNAENQLDRMKKMYESGIKSLTDLESKQLALREAEAKRIALENKLDKKLADKENMKQEANFVNADVSQKLAKLSSEIESVKSSLFSALGESNKLQSKYDQIEQRQAAFVITSPIKGRIMKVLKNGLGEFVKSGESLLTIVPSEYQKAVELYIKPNDMPLVSEGKRVRLQFDGWPAVVFSGWPDNSFGTFGGKVFAIDNDISENGKYRILVIEDSDEKPWPHLIRIGSGAKGLLLLNDVRIYYELWRQLNGFPPDFYTTESKETIKNKAPIKKIK